MNYTISIPNRVWVHKNLQPTPFQLTQEKISSGFYPERSIQSIAYTYDLGGLQKVIVFVD